MKTEFNEARTKILDIVDKMSEGEAIKLLSVIIGVVMDESDTTEATMKHKGPGLTVKVMLTNE